MLEEEVKKLEAEITVKKLEKDVKAKQEAVGLLKSKKSDLERELREQESGIVSERPAPESVEEVEEEQETGVTVTTVPVEEEKPLQSQEESKTEKKKRLFF